MTWLASSWMENLTPSSEEKELMGDSVPEVRTMVRTQSLRSEKACYTHTHTQGTASEDGSTLGHTQTY